MNVDVVTVGFSGHGFVEILPPTIQEPFLADETKPRRKQQIGIVHHVNESLSSDPLNSIYFVGMRFDGELGLILDAEEENIVNLMLSPRANDIKKENCQQKGMNLEWVHISRFVDHLPVLSVRNCVCRPVVKASQELELFNWQLAGWDAQLMVKLSDSSILHAHDSGIGNIFWCVNLWRFHSMKRVRTARVGPNLIKREESNVG